MGLVFTDSADPDELKRLFILSKLFVKALVKGSLVFNGLVFFYSL